MKQSGSAQLPAPVAPAVPATPGANQVVVGPRGIGPIVYSKADIAAFRTRGNVLSDQLQSATGRRNRLHQSLQQATGTDRAGLEQRLGVLDTRIARLEMDIDENGKVLASLPAVQVPISQEPFGLAPRANKVMENLTPIAIVFTIFVLAPIAISIARGFWRRGSISTHPSASPEQSQRLERMEQAIDAIAIEMERVSEGQRFVTRLLSEQKQGIAIGNARPGSDPVPVPANQRMATPQ